MNWFYEVERIAAEHRAAVRRMEYCIEDIDTAAHDRTRALSERWYAQYKEEERRKAVDLDNEVAMRDRISHEGPTRATQDRLVRNAPVGSRHWVEPAVDPIDWNQDAEDFPKPKSWLV